MKQSSKRLVSMVMVLGFLMAALLVYFELVQPSYGELQKKKGTQISSEDFLSQEEQIIAQAKKLLVQYDSTGASDDRKNLALAMPSGQDIAGAVAQLYGIATANNVALKTIAPAPGAVQQPQKEAASEGIAGAPLTASQVVRPMASITIQLTGSGTYESIKAFIAGLETNTRIFDVTSLSILTGNSAATTGKNVPGSEIFTFNIGVATYYQLP